MNENSIIAIIDAIAAQFGIMIDWTAQNVAPYLQDLMSRVISYEIGISIFWMIFMPVLATGLVIVTMFLWKKCKSDPLDYLEDSVWLGPSITATIVAGAAIIVSLVAIPCNIIHIIECVNIPEKVFIDFIGTYMG